jgi:hypothetical protein
VVRQLDETMVAEALNNLLRALLALRLVTLGEKGEIQRR